jgi:hypothetical protein
MNYPWWLTVAFACLAVGGWVVVIRLDRTYMKLWKFWNERYAAAVADIYEDWPSWDWPERTKR